MQNRTDLKQWKFIYYGSLNTFHVESKIVGSENCTEMFSNSLFFKKISDSWNSLTQFWCSQYIITVIRILQISDFPSLRMTNILMVSIMSAMHLSIL